LTELQSVRVALQEDALVPLQLCKRIPLLSEASLRRPQTRSLGLESCSAGVAVLASAAPQRDQAAAQRREEHRADPGAADPDAEKGEAVAAVAR